MSTNNKYNIYYIVFIIYYNMIQIKKLIKKLK